MFVVVVVVVVVVCVCVCGGGGGSYCHPHGWLFVEKEMQAIIIIYFLTCFIQTMFLQFIFCHHNMETQKTKYVPVCTYIRF